MKYCSLIILFLLLFASCGNEPTLVGIWQLESISGEELSESEKEVTITFKEDGTFLQRDGDVKLGGTWSSSNDGSTITLVPDGQETNVMRNVQYQGNKVSFTDGDGKDTITLNRVSTND